MNLNHINIKKRRGLAPSPKICDKYSLSKIFDKDKGRRGSMTMSEKDIIELAAQKAAQVTLETLAK